MKRANAIIQKHVDISCMLTTSMDEAGNERRLAVFRSPIAEVGSRYPYLPNAVDLSYENIKNAVAEAVQKQVEIDGMTTTTTNSMVATEEITYDFNELMNEAKALYTVFEAAGYARDFAIAVEKILGVGHRISDCTEHQAEAVYAVNAELKDKAKELGIA